jgi:glycosyltransferase involved in cell wall biosynthesis
MKLPRLDILYPYPTGKAPSQRFRIELYLTFLQKEYDVHIYPFWSVKSWSILYKKGHLFAKFIGFIGAMARRKYWLFFKAYKADLIYIHREAMPVGFPFSEWFLVKILKKKIIYDFDDAIWLPNQSEANRGLVKHLKFHSKVGKICSWAHTVCVGNEYLAAYARQFNDNVVVIPTTVDTEGYHNPELHETTTLRPFDNAQSKLAQLARPKRSEGGGDMEITEHENIPIIGWTGTHSTLHQLELIWPILDDLINKFPFTFHVISDSFPEMLPAYVRTIYWNKDSEISDLLKFDIGVMPLKDNEWEKGKCGFKLIQYMALEIPAVASDVGVNGEILHSPELGFLIPSNDVHAWKESLIKLLSDKELRIKMGKAGRKKVIGNYSVEANKEKVLGLFS